MNFLIINRKTKRDAKSNLDIATLPAVLSALGVSKRRGNNGHYNKTYRSRCLTDSSLYELLEEAKMMHRERIKRAHPDRGGRHTDAAHLNLAWSRVKELIGRRGVYLPLLLFCFGCASHQVKQPVIIQSRMSSQNVVGPPAIWIHWNPSASFDEGSKYVLLSSTNLSGWNTLYEGVDTNAYSPVKAYEYYILYATNVITQEFYWSTVK